MENKQWFFANEITGANVAPGIERKVLAYCDEVMSVQNDFEKGAVGVMHNHPHTQIVYVLSGVFEFTISGVTNIVKKGDTMMIEPNEMHGGTCIEKGSLLDIFTPKRDDFL